MDKVDYVKRCDDRTHPHLTMPAVKLRRITKLQLALFLFATPGLLVIELSARFLAKLPIRHLYHDAGDVVFVFDAGVHFP